MLAKDAKHAGLLLLLALIVLLTACSSQQVNVNAGQTLSEPHYRSCRLLVNELETTVNSHRVSDAAAPRIKGFPYLRVNRLLASFRDEVAHPEKFNDWIERLNALALSGWELELKNLPVNEQQRIEKLASAVQGTDTNSALKYCSQVLKRVELNTEQQRTLLAEQALVADNYKMWQRILGLYPLTSLAFRLGIDSWHHKTRATFALAPEALPVTGALVGYMPGKDTTRLGFAQSAVIIQSSSQNALHIPEPSATELQQLFDTYAPVFEIDTLTDDDRIGAVRIDDNAVPFIDTGAPLVYQYVSHTRYQEQVLLQLNYLAWFPARTKTSSWDLLGGHLDGIIWRVTLLPDGRPLLFDSIHACGCYHLLFPTQYAAVKATRSGYEEPLLFPDELEVMEYQRPRIRLGSGSHYIQHVGYGAAALSKHTTYATTKADTLRSLELATGKRKNLYNPEGLVTSSQRGERFFFWPMGVPSPGAMRQPGTHATAFVGRRHFDDAYLFEPYIVPVQLAH